MESLPYAETDLDYLKRIAGPSLDILRDSETYSDEKGHAKSREGAALHAFSPDAHFVSSSLHWRRTRFSRS